MTRRRHHFIQHAVRVDTDAELVLERFEVDIAGVVLDGHQQHHVQQLAHRRAIGQRFDAGQINGTARADCCCDGLFQFGVFLQLTQDVLDAVCLARVVDIQSTHHFALGGHHEPDVVSKEVPQLVLNRQVLRITSRQCQYVAVAQYGNHPIQLRHRFGKRGDDLFF